MSTEVTKWDEELAKYAKQDAEKVTPSSSVISLKAGVITYNGQKAPGNKLNCIVVGSVSERSYYPDDYDPDNPASPACFGLDTDTVTAPHPMSAEPQSDACATCPMNKWGSAARGKGKACKEKVRLAIIPSKLSDGEAVLKAEIARLTMPVMSVKNWSNYVTLVSHSKKRPTFAVETQIGTQPDPKSQFVVTFEYVDDVPVALTPYLLEKRELATEVLMTPFEPREAGEAKPTAKGSKHKA